MDPLTASNNDAKSRFEIVTDGHTAFASYSLRPGEIVLTHTEVPKELGGRGIANVLARAALEYARANGLKVVPQCPFMARFIDRNPEYQPLVKG
jgi:predicted GNAT family acetyltransferase